MNRALVVELRSLRRAAVTLGSEGFDVRTVVDGAEDPVEAARAVGSEVVVLEAGPIGARVLDLCAALSAASAAPVVVTCESSSESDTLAAYAAGAATVLVEPVGPHEFVARVRALVRRGAPPPIMGSDTVVVDDVVLDLASRRITVRGQVVDVPRREFEIAVMLMRNAGNLVSRQSLIEALWGGTARDSKSLDVQVGRLRSRLARVEGFRRILTVRGVGYRFLTAQDVERRRLRDAGSVSGAS